MKTKLIVLFALMALVIFSFTATGAVKAGPLNAAYQGGADVHAYCKASYWFGSAVLVPPMDAYSWRCSTLGVKKSIDMTAVCRWEYGRTASARTSNPSDPWSWKCYR